MKDSYVAAKEAWAKKARAPLNRAVSGPDRLPPGQRLVTDFPTLDLGIQPEVTRETWELKVHGRVDGPINLSWEKFLSLPQLTVVSDFHCVTTWSQFDMEFTGTRFAALAELVRPAADARHVFFKAYDGYTTNNPLDALMDDDVLIAHSWNGLPLTREHGGPARVIIPKRYAWKGAKWVSEIVFLDHDQPGFWETRGYSNTADPFTEDRFA